MRPTSTLVKLENIFKIFKIFDSLLHGNRTHRSARARTTSIARIIARCPVRCTVSYLSTPCTHQPKATATTRTTMQSARVARRAMSTAAVWVDKNTKLVVQGFTGKQVHRMVTLSSGNLLVLRSEALDDNDIAAANQNRHAAIT